MDFENSRSNINSSNKDDGYAKEQLNPPTLVTLAAKASARVKVLPVNSLGIRTTATATTPSTITTLTVAESATSTAAAPSMRPVATINQAGIALLPPENTDKSLSQKSVDSDCTLQSDDQSESNVLKALVAAQSSDEKVFASVQTLDRILLAHSEQTITTARVELLDSNTSRTTRELMLQAGSQGVTKSLAATRDAAMVAGAEGGEGARGVSGNGNGEGLLQTTPTDSVRSIGSLVCRICHNAENPEKLVSPCLCKGSLTYVHIHCLERWISTSRSTICELCQFQYNTEQTLRYTCFQSLRMWYSRSMSRRALQEDCQMFSLLTLVAFGIIGTLLVGIQYYFLQGETWGMSRAWTKGWLIFFLFTTLTIYFINIYMILKSQLSPWYRWWQSARDIKLILENRKPFKFRPNRRLQNHQLAQELSDMAQQQQQQQNIDNTPPSSTAVPQAAPTSTPQQPYHPNQPITTTATVSSVPIHYTSTPIPMPRANIYHLPMCINSIELQRNEYYEYDVDDATVRYCDKRPLVMTTCKGTAVALHRNKLTNAATIELEGRLYDWGTIQ
ncbi:uncharacterized protein LOC129245640 [Anastrepha obliqua]|uniref:uncharacterized protein LOC129245640 n=1 Tax=Anastrepha obliqua TaxID=95512 RepID=UPI00240A2D01|nr:uncharacterized protein LOC129245640 [Anastrepha obliqua]